MINIVQYHYYVMVLSDPIRFRQRKRVVLNLTQKSK